jgi:hypothetical protein
MHNTEMCSYTRLRWLRWALFRITGISDTQALDAEGEQACSDINDVDLAWETQLSSLTVPPSTLLCTEVIHTDPLYRLRSLHSNQHSSVTTLYP